MTNTDGPAATHTDDGRYRLLVDSITDYAIYMLDPHGVVTSWNPGAQRFKGVVPRGDSELLGSMRDRLPDSVTRSAGASVIVEADTPHG